MKKLLFSMVLVFALGMAIKSSYVYASNNGPYTFDGNAAYITQPISAPKYYVGPKTQAISTATISATTATNYGMVATVYLATASAAAVQGQVIVSTTGFASQGIEGAVGTATNQLTTVIGVADAAASTGTYINVLIHGVGVALTTGTVNAGDILVTTNTAAGYLATNNSASTNAMVGLALTAGNANGGLTYILIY